MSNTRTSTLERNGNSNKGINKLGSPWSRAITSNSEWNDKVTNEFPAINTSVVSVIHAFFFLLISNLGRISRCSLLVETSIRHHNWHCVGHHSIARFHRNHTVSVHDVCRIVWNAQCTLTHTHTLSCSGVARTAVSWRKQFAGSCSDINDKFLRRLHAGQPKIVFKIITDESICIENVFKMAQFDSFVAKTWKRKFAEPNGLSIRNDL